ncbi:hypothetical protein H710_00419 [Bartonella bacilliformis Ver097]|uniref:Uncharacterized protein n=1 Tax=Bartonella bacilliformis Ver097 TaxID=1293911 RepID=A0A072RFT1_BARBA|nr:hypothetical protein H710_00419 [Bartonella bacilliformis Ver097]
MSVSGLFYENSAALYHLVVEVIKGCICKAYVFYRNFLRSVNMMVGAT